MKIKETSYKNVLKNNLILFLSYGILTGFIFLILVLIVKYALVNLFSLPLSITLSLIAGILLFYLFHFICKSSTLESFRKEKLSVENANRFLQKMNLFFTLCIVFSILMCIGYLFYNHFLFSHSIAQAYENYEFISSDFANEVIQQINEEYQNSLPRKVFSTVILELSLVVTFFSLIPYQKKMLYKYNQSAD